METLRRRRVYLLFGWGFGVLGAAGILIPAFPSLFLLLMALVFLAKAKPRFRYIRMNLKRRYPRLIRAFGEAELRAAQLGRGEFIESIRNDMRKGKERRRVDRLMRRRLAQKAREARRAMRAGLVAAPGGAPVAVAPTTTAYALMTNVIEGPGRG